MVCTDKGLKNVPFSMWDNTTEFKEIGIGYSLYFDVMKFLLLISLGIFILFALPSMFFNYDGNECLPEEQIEILKERIMGTSYSDRTLLEGKSYFLPSIFGSLGEKALTMGNEMKTVMFFYCLTKNFVGSEENCSSFSDMN